METITLYVGPELVDCVGVGPQKCMQVRRSLEEPYTYFYNPIVGFEFEAGYTYELRVEVTEVPHPPADASSLKYTLKEIISKEPMETTKTLEGTRWILTSYLNEDGATVEALPNVEATATFEDGRVGGNSSCNRYGAGYTVAGNKLSVSEQMMSTMMACPPPVMDQERQFQANLVAAATYTIAGSTLTIADAGGQVLLTMAADVPASLVGTTWVARNYNNGKQAVVSILQDTKITVVFGEDGRLAGSAGCNRYNAAYVAEDGTITIQPPATTRMMCRHPVGIMEQEAQYLRSLTTAATYRIEGQKLELRTESGALVASYMAEAAE